MDLGVRAHGYCSEVRTRLLAFGCVVALGLIPAPAPAATPDVEVTRLEFAAPDVAPGSSVLVRVGVVAQAAQQSVLTFSGLPSGAKIVGPQCQRSRCTVTVPEGPTIVDLRLDLAAATPTGTSSIEVSTSDSSVDENLKVVRGAKPQLRYRVTSDVTLVPGTRARLKAHLVNLSGSTTTGIEVQRIMAPDALKSQRAAGPGWRCEASTCRYRRPLAVGERSATLSIRGVLQTTPGATPLGSQSRTRGAHADLRWKSTISTAGLELRETNSLLVQLKAPRSPKPPSPRVSVPNWTRQSHLEATVVPETTMRAGQVGRLRIGVLQNRVLQTKGRTTLRVQLPRGLRTEDIRDGAWRCTGNVELRCTIRRAVSERRPAPPVTLNVRAARGIKGPQKVRAIVRWRTKSGMHTDADSARLPVLPALRVKARTSKRVVWSTPAGNRLAARPVQLHARIRGADVRTRPSYRWRQISGPKVSWQTPTMQRVGQLNVGARFQAPVVKKRRTLVFEVTAGLNGARARDRVKVVVKPRRVSVFPVANDVAGQPFGIDGLELSDVFIDIDGKQPPALQCTSPLPNQQTESFTAIVQDFFGEDVAVQGVINGSGVCLYGQLTDFRPTGSSNDSSFQNTMMIYSSYNTTITIPGLSPITVDGQSVGLLGDFTAPASMSKTLGGLQGKGSFQAIVTEQSGGFGFNGTVDYTLDSPIYLVGSASPTQSSLALDGVSLTVNVAASTLDIQLAADGSYYTPPATNGETPASTTPLSVGIDINLGQGSFGFTATAAGSKPVIDAFGQPGLVLNNLVVAGSIGEADSLAIAADAELPSSWVSFVGVEPNTDVSLVVDISVTPCLQFSVGRAGQTEAAVDLLNKGVLIADYANVVLAPVGCEFANVVDIQPGFALDFDGLIAGDPIAFNVALDLTAGNFSLAADVEIGRMTIGSVQLQNSMFTLGLSDSFFEVSFGATVVVGDSSLTVQGAYTEQNVAVTASFSVVSQGDVSIAGFVFDNATVDFSYTATPQGSTMTFSLDGDVGFLDQSIDGTLALTAQNGSVQTASGDFGVSVNLVVVDVSGNLQFAYQAGVGASGSFSNGTVTVFDLLTFTDVNGTLAANGAYQVSAYTPIPQNQAKEADAWLYVKEHGDWNTIFSGTLGVSISGGDGASASVDYSASSVGVWSQWAWHSWTKWGSWVAIPVAGCDPTTVIPGPPFSEPEAVFNLQPLAVEVESQGGHDNDTNYCVNFSSLVVL